MEIHVDGPLAMIGHETWKDYFDINYTGICCLYPICLSVHVFRRFMCLSSPYPPRQHPLVQRLVTRIVEIGIEMCIDQTKPCQGMAES